MCKRSGMRVPIKKIEYYNVIIKIELIDVKIKSFALTRTLFIDVRINVAQMIFKVYFIKYIYLYI